MRSMVWERALKNRVPVDLIIVIVVAVTAVLFGLGWLSWAFALPVAGLAAFVYFNEDAHRAAERLISH